MWHLKMVSNVSYFPLIEFFSKPDPQTREQHQERLKPLIKPQLLEKIAQEEEDSPPKLKFEGNLLQKVMEEDQSPEKTQEATEESNKIEPKPETIDNEQTAMENPVNTTGNERGSLRPEMLKQLGDTFKEQVQQDSLNTLQEKESGNRLQGEGGSTKVNGSESDLRKNKGKFKIEVIQGVNISPVKIVRSADIVQNRSAGKSVRLGAEQDEIITKTEQDKHRTPTQYKFKQNVQFTPESNKEGASPSRMLLNNQFLTRSGGKNSPYVYQEG